MSIPAIYAWLTASADVMAIVADANPLKKPHIYFGGVIPQSDNGVLNSNLPCVTVQPSGGRPENVMDDRPSFDENYQQIDCWALTYAEAETLAAKCKYALELHGNCTSFNPVGPFEHETFRYRVSFVMCFIMSHS